MASPFGELEIGGRTVKVTNPDKVIFPDAGHTKRDLVDYYLAVGEGIVRALRERPTQLRRFPDAIAGEQIYQKRVPEKRPDRGEVARVTFPSGRHADELCVTEVAQVVWAANLAVVDFHPWPSRRADVDRPDELRIDAGPHPVPPPPPPPARPAGPASTVPTNCGSTSTRSQARRSRAGNGSRRSSGRRSTRSATAAGPRPRGARGG